MIHFLNIIGKLAWLLCLLAFFWGCGNQSDVPQKPKVVRKKIVASAKVRPQTKKAVPAKAPTSVSGLRPKSDIARTPAKQTQPPKVAKTGPKAPPATVAAAKPSLRPKSDIAKSPAEKKPTSPPPVAQKSTPPPPVAQKSRPPVAGPATAKPAVAPQTAVPAKPDKGLKKPALPASAAGKTVIPAAAKKAGKKKPGAKKKGVPPVYNPEGKTDPFKPLFKEKPDMPKVKKKKKRRIPRTPLEKLALSQLKLVGIILAKSGNRALVQEASGKGYIIKKGTYIGLNSGKVVEIKKDKVIIEEEVENIVGKLMTRNKELTLPKPAGEK